MKKFKVEWVKEYESSGTIFVNAYTRDFHFCRGLPAGIDFKVRKVHKDKYKLIADGHGSDKDYGNGPIYVCTSVKGNEALKRRLERWQKE